MESKTANSSHFNLIEKLLSEDIVSSLIYQLWIIYKFNLLDYNS